MQTARYARSADRNLAAEGYAFAPSVFGTDFALVVKPNGFDFYTVDTVNETCTCEAGQRGAKCCHVREAISRKATARAQAAADSFRADRAAYNAMRAADFD